MAEAARDLALHEAPSHEVSETSAIINLIDRASRDPTVDIDKLDRLLQMRERVSAQAARSDFDAAMAKMQTELPEITENGEIVHGEGAKAKLISTYALWEDVNKAIKPVLSANGFALSFRSGREADQVIVTGILSHSGGHREETTFRLPLDTSGAKNNVQAVGSSDSYGRRYAATALLNLTSRGQDDDGKKGGDPASVTDDQASDIQALIEDVKADKTRFLAFFKVPSISEIPAKRFKEAVAMLEAKRGK